MKASGMLNFEGWAKGNGVGKKHVGMAINKASVGNEMAAWGHSFPADEIDGDGRYTDKNTALPALVSELIAISGGHTFVRKSAFDNAPRNTAWLDHDLAAAATPAAAIGGGEDGREGGGDSDGCASGVAAALLEAAPEAAPQAAPRVRAGGCASSGVQLRRQTRTRRRPPRCAGRSAAS